MVRQAFSKIVFLSLIFAVALSASSQKADAIAIGVAPGILNVGDVYPGTSKLVEFFLITTATEDMLVSMSSIDPHFDFYTTVHDGHYKFFPEESSNEYINGWISFPENPVRVSPGETITHTFPQGETIRANKRVRAILTVPKDADPGYHVGSINFAPQLASGTGGLATMAVSRFVYVFYVKPLEDQPEPLRSGKITDIEARRVEGDRVRIDVLFQNTGTDTVFVKVKTMDIFDNFGTLMKTVESGYERVKPRETKVLSAFWNDKDARGLHRVKAEVDFLTGSLTADTEVTIPEEITSGLGLFPSPTGMTTGFPWWIIIVFVVMIALIAYFKSDWVWIMVLLGLIIAVLVIIGLLISPPNIDVYSIPWWLIIIIIAVISLVIYWKI